LADIGKSGGGSDVEMAAKSHDSQGQTAYSRSGDAVLQGV